jgi:phospholipase D-like protein
LLPALVSLPLIAQTSDDSGPAAAAGGCALCGSLLMIPVLIFALNIALLVWVARDAKARGMDNSVLWMLLVMFTSVIGLIIYLFSRPQGNVIQCRNCQNKRLQVSARCPHCGNA